MVQFSDEDKEVKEFNNNYFGFGVHKVKIAFIELNGTGEGEKEYMNVTVMDPENEEITDEVRLYFVGGATNISLNTLRQILVHNAPEDKKDAARELFDAVKDSAELEKLLNEKMLGGECWYTKYYDAKGATYVNKKGETKVSVRTNIVGYAPRLREDLMPKTDPSMAPVTAETFPDEPFGKTPLGGTPASAEDQAKIPDSWS